MSSACPTCGDVLATDSARCYRCVPYLSPAHSSRWFNRWRSRLPDDLYMNFETWHGCLANTLLGLGVMVGSIILIFIGYATAWFFPPLGYIFVLAGAGSILVVGYTLLFLPLPLAISFLKMRLEDKLKSLSVVTAAVAVLLFIRMIIVFEFADYELLSIAGCLAFSLACWMIGSRFETKRR